MKSCTGVAKINSETAPTSNAPVPTRVCFSNLITGFTCIAHIIVWYDRNEHANENEDFFKYFTIYVNMLIYDNYSVNDIKEFFWFLTPSSVISELFIRL